MTRRLHLAWMVLAVLVMLGVTLAGLDHAFPLATERLDSTSAVVTDRQGVPLRVFTTPDGRWRLPVDPDAVSPGYRALLFATEDKRFWRHPGVDPLAMLRAVGQVLRHGRVISGGSTLTMQVVRLLEPRPRTMRSKLIEIARALQLEVHWSKADILRSYLTLAPMGGNLEGLRAGSLAWFGKEPAQLSDAEAALAVLLPQNPNGRRPDRHPVRAEAARARLLARAVAEGVIAAEALPSVLATPLPHARRPMPRLAPHRSEALVANAGSGAVIRTTLDATLQASLETLLADALDAVPRPATLAAVVADWRSGAILARVGNAVYGDPARLGAVDMADAVRSPGSTLKPFIYGLAFETLAAHPGSLVHDAATRFDDYAPHNFDRGFNGDVTVRQALQWSLNLPAVITLSRVGPVAFSERLAAAGVPLDLGDPPAPPGLPIALGGVGTSLTRLLATYTALPGHGTVHPLFDVDEQGEEVWAWQADPPRRATAGWRKRQPDPRSSVEGDPLKRPSNPSLAQRGEKGFQGSIEIRDTVQKPARAHGEGNATAPTPLLQPAAADAVADILSDMPPPAGTSSRSGRIAYKTGTSYRFRDGWAVGFDGGRVAGVWIGRADGGSCSTCVGASAAALLFRVFALWPPDPLPRQTLAPVFAASPPPTLRRLDAPGAASDAAGPHITFPVARSRIQADLAAGSDAAVKLAALGGSRPYRWLVDGKPVESRPFARETLWRPQAEGFSTVTVIDAEGRSDAAQVRISAAATARD